MATNNNSLFDGYLFDDTPTLDYSEYGISQADNPEQYLSSGLDGATVAQEIPSETDFSSLFEQATPESGPLQFGSDIPLAGSEDGGFNPLNIVEKAASTFDGFVKSILGPEGAQKMYASAISAGVAAILQGSKNDAAIKFRNADREDTQAHNLELLGIKNKREDEARARKNAVPGSAGGRVAYKPQATRNYQAPGAANTQTYGFLKG